MQVLSSLSSIPFYAPSAGFAPTNSADVSAIASSYAESAASGKLDATASANFYPSDNPSGFISSVDLSDYATTAYVDSSVSSKLDATASSQFLTAVPAGYATTEYVDSSISGFAYESAVSGWTAKQDALTFGYDTSDKINAINGSALAGEGGGLVTAIGTSENGISSINGSGLVDTAALRSSDYSSLYVQEPLYISASGESSYIGISGDIGGIDSATCSAIASAYAESAASSKLDSSASSSFYSTSNPSGFLTTSYTPTFGYNAADQISSIDGSALGGMDEAAVSGIASAYAESAVSAASSNYYTTANESGFFNSASVGFNADNQISSIGGSAIAAGDGVSVSPSGTILISGISAEATDSAFLPSATEETFVSSISQGSQWIDSYSTFTINGVNKIVITSADLYEPNTINISSNGTLFSSVPVSTGAWNSLTLSVPDAPITIGANPGLVLVSWDAYNVYNMPDRVVPLMHQSAMQSAYASASATQATAQNVLYILLPDGV